MIGQILLFGGLLIVLIGLFAPRQRSYSGGGYEYRGNKNYHRKRETEKEKAINGLILSIVFVTLLLILMISFGEPTPIT